MSDAVNHPSYYNRGKIEVIDFIEDWKLDFSMGNFVKYMCRAGRKDDAVQDLEKAKWYLTRFAEHPSEPYIGGTYNWIEYANSQDLSKDLCIAFGAAYLVYLGQGGPYLGHAISVINDEIESIKHKLKHAMDSIDHGVLETGA